MSVPVDQETRGVLDEAVQSIGVGTSAQLAAALVAAACGQREWPTGFPVKAVAKAKR